MLSSAASVAHVWYCEELGSQTCVGGTAFCWSISAALVLHVKKVWLYVHLEKGGGF